ncbi:MAG: glycosylase [Acholeplasmataceae bacterium]
MPKIIGDRCPHMPWEERPSGSHEVVWRSARNPIIGRNPVPGVARIFNSAIVPYEKAFIGVFRAETDRTFPELRIGFSQDGYHWEIADQAIAFENADNEQYAYDPRVVRIRDTYYITWCTDYHGPTIGLAETKDFKRFRRLENAFLPYNRNGVLFPRKIRGRYVMLSRPSDSGHTPFGDIFLSESEDMEFWGRHRHVMAKGQSGWWENLKIGGGPAPIETDEGFLLFYHGVTETCNGFVYSMGAALLDRERPECVKHRAASYCLTPEESYEVSGFVPNVVFPCATVQDAETGRIAIYYGAADTYTALAFTTLEGIISFIKGEN